MARHVTLRFRESWPHVVGVIASRSRLLAAASPSSSTCPAKVAITICRKHDRCRERGRYADSGRLIGPRDGPERHDLPRSRALVTFHMSANEFDTSSADCSEGQSIN